MLKKISLGILVSLLLSVIPLGISSANANPSVSTPNIQTFLPNQALTTINENFVVSGFNASDQILVTIGLTGQDADTLFALPNFSTSGVTLGSGYNSYSDGTAVSDLAIKGTQAQVNAAISGLKIKTGSNLNNFTVNVSASIASNSVVQSGSTQSFYEYVPASRITWANAKTAATNKTFAGVNGYLVTITSDAENNFVKSRIGGALNVWIGASDSTVEGDWRWVTGPESQSGGTTFWKSIGGVVTYSSWAGSEPNDSDAGRGGEDHAVTNWNSANGLWNDLNGDNTNQIAGYVVEYSEWNGQTFAATTVAKTSAQVVMGGPVLTATAGEESASLSWTVPNRAGRTVSSYSVSSIPSVAGVSACTGTSTSCEVTGLTAGTSYSFQVTATWDDSTPSKSNSSSVRALAVGAPSLIATAGQESAALSWTTPTRTGKTVTQYTVSSSPSVSGVSACTGTATSCTVEGLTAGTSYSFTVTATWSDSITSVSNSYFARPTVVDGPVLTATAGQESAVLSWTSISRVGKTITSYSVSSTPSVTGVSACTGTVTSCTVSGLTAGTSYSFVVTVNWNDSQTSTSNTASITALEVSANTGGGTSSPALTPTTTPTPTPTPTRSTSPIVRNTPLLSGPVNTGTNVNRLGNTPQTLIGGVPTNTTARVVDPTKLNLLAGALNLEIQVPQNVGSVTNNGGSTQLQVQKGGVTTINGSGLRPLSTVQVFLPLGGNNPRELARIPVTSSGTFNGLATFANPTQGAPLPIGPQVLQIVSVDQSGRQAVVEMKVNIAQPAPAPEQNRQAGILPDLNPGQSIATEAGIPVSVIVEAIEQQRQAIIQGDTWNMSINVPNANGQVTKTDGGALLKFIQNETVFVEGDGFLPGTRADVWLFSDPTLLGTVEIDENGNFSGQIAVDGKFVPTGEHTLQIQGVGDDGFIRSANLGVVVEANTSSPITSNVWVYALLGVGLVAITAFFTLARRGKREAKHS